MNYSCGMRLSSSSLLQNRDLLPGSPLPLDLTRSEYHKMRYSDREYSLQVWRIPQTQTPARLITPQAFALCGFMPRFACADYGLLCLCRRNARGKRNCYFPAFPSRSAFCSCAARRPETASLARSGRMKGNTQMPRPEKKLMPLPLAFITTENQQVPKA